MTCFCGTGCYWNKEAHKRIVLFGPPGVGKRTILAEASSRGLDTVDLVTQGRNHRQRLDAFQHMLETPVEGIQLINAADLRIEDFPDDVEVVLILPPMDAYLRRYQECCEMRPEERAHNEELIFQQISSIQYKFSRVIRGDKSPEQALDAILAPYDWEASLANDSETGPSAEGSPVPLQSKRPPEDPAPMDEEQGARFATNPLMQMDESLVDPSEQNVRDKDGVAAL